MSRGAVVGAGPAGLMAAERLATAGVRVTVYDRMPSVGRKFLLAGRGGLNLTHSEPLETFLDRYRPSHEALRAAIAAFPPQRLREWCEMLGQPTFVGTSGRVFPKAMKASPLLRAWLRRLNDADVTFAMRHRFIGWRDGGLSFARPDGTIVTDRPDVTVLALGGASWPRLGSDGGWVAALAEAGVTISPLRPANCGFRVPWSQPFRSRRAGTPLKRIAVTFAGETVRGEAIITADGIEGGAIYALSRPLREAIVCDGSAVLAIDLRPDLTQADLATRLAKARVKESLSTTLRKNVRLSPAAIDLLREAAIRPGPPARWTAGSGTRRHDQGGVPSSHRRGRHRARHLRGRRGVVRRDRRAFHAAQAAGRLRGRRDARLGGADRWLSPPGVVCNRCGRGRRRTHLPHGMIENPMPTPV
jgi:uncharacterized flavoprotein (TIGR03862 family)